MLQMMAVMVVVEERVVSNVSVALEECSVVLLKYHFVIHYSI
ncbi:unnamed protein product [Schistosoma margrebowiei]|uniref:Uncharacterized protein n=1 Tax=Schistosoma margrebowiei TaxID=48269 RepID=A0A183N5Z2_9TREM|nr:unnamed protein product [Schistosoma margrebowiei]